MNALTSTSNYLILFDGIASEWKVELTAVQVEAEKLAERGIFRIEVQQFVAGILNKSVEYVYNSGSGTWDRA